MMMFSKIQWQNLIQQMPQLNSKTQHVGYSSNHVGDTSAFEQLAAAWGNQGGDSFGESRFSINHLFSQTPVGTQNQGQYGYTQNQYAPVFGGNVRGFQGHNTQKNTGFTTPSAFFEAIGNTQNQSYLNETDEDFPPFPPREMLEKLQAQYGNQGQYNTSNNGNTDQNFPPFPPREMLEKLQAQYGNQGQYNTSNNGNTDQNFPPFPPPQMLQQLKAQYGNQGDYNTSNNGNTDQNFPPFPPREMLEKLQAQYGSQGEYNTSNNGNTDQNFPPFPPREMLEKLQAQTAHRGTSSSGGHSMPSFNVSELDTNQDGQISAEEWINAILKKRTTETDSTQNQW
jgi:hypothetical protein